MVAHSPASARAPRLNPFAFLSDTSFRFALLIGIVVGAHIYLSMLHQRSDVIKCIEEAKKANQKPKDPGAFRKEEREFAQIVREFIPAQKALSENDDNDTKAERRVEDPNDPTIDPLVQCRALFKTVGSSVALMLGVAWAIYWSFPARKIRRDRLVFLSTEDTPELVDRGLVDYLEGLCHEAGVAPARTGTAGSWVDSPQVATTCLVFLLDRRNGASDAQAFGRLGTYYISLTHGLVTLFLQADFPRFRAKVLHELAHLRNADVDKTYFAVALWWAFLIVSLPVLLWYVALALGLFGFRHELQLEAWDRVLWFLALTVWVYLARNNILRAREFYADVRASVWEWDGLCRLLAEACPHSNGKTWHTLWQRQYHPTPAERLRVLHDTSLLFRLGFWDAMGVGMATAFGLLSVAGWPWFDYIPYMVWFLWPLFVFLAIGGVGLGVWRGTFAALMRGETPREAGRLGLGLALGFLVGEILFSVFSVGFLQATMSSWFLDRGLSYLLWNMLLVGILVLCFKWVEMGAATWIPVSLRSRSPRWAYRIGSGSLVLWFGALLHLAVFQYWLPLFPNIEESIALALASFLGLIGLWAFPLAPWFWRCRIASAPISNWPFLEAPPPQLTLLPPVLLRPGLALMVGLTGGLLFVVLSPFHIQVPLELVEQLFHLGNPKAAFLFGQIAAAALIQMGVAALVAGWIKRLGLLHALFAAFIAGCIMTGAIWDLYPSVNVLVIFPLVIPGTLLALPTAFGVSVVANWIRHSLAGAILLPAEEAEQKKALQRALRTAQQMAVLFVTVGVVAAIIQVTSNRLTEKEFFQRRNEITKELGEKALIDQKQVVAEFDEIGLETMLLPETLTKKSGIEENRRKLKRWTEFVERNVIRSRAAVKEVEERFGSVASESEYEAEFLRGVAKGIRNREHLERQMDAYAKASIAARTKMNEFMAARLGKVVVQDGQLMFDTQDEADTYNQYLEEIDKQEQLAADLEQRYLQGLQQRISKLAR